MGPWFKKLALGLDNNLLSVSLDLISSDPTSFPGLFPKKMGGAVREKPWG